MDGGTRTIAGAASRDADREVTAELSIVIPTFNEAQNVPFVVQCLSDALAGVRWEVIFVDDNSPDGTTPAARKIARSDPRVRCIRRIGRRGLAGACIEGMLASSATVVAVMDGDLQHDEALLPRMLESIRQGADLVVGTRFAPGGAAERGFSRVRHLSSQLATQAAKRILGVPLRIVELPFEFRSRRHGDSKLDSLVILEYFGLLLAKVSGDWLSIRFVLFALVGSTGLFVHLWALREALAFGIAFDWAQMLAAVTAMTSNFFLNNQLTYRDRRLRGLAAFRGLLTFYAVCSVGAVANVGVAHWVYGSQSIWWLAGTAGAIMGVVFNYAASSVLTWRRS